MENFSVMEGILILFEGFCNFDNLWRWVKVKKVWKFTDSTKSYKFNTDLVEMRSKYYPFLNMNGWMR